MPSQSERPGTTRWQMKQDCIFVDSYLLKDDDYLSVEKREPKEILPYAHVMNKVKEAEANREVILLNDVAAFIMRFIALGVDTDKHLPDIVHSEYGGKLSEVKSQIESIVQEMRDKGYIEPRQVSNIPQPDPKMKEFKVTKKNYPLEAGVHSIGPTIIRLPR